MVLEVAGAEVHGHAQALAPQRRQERTQAAQGEVWAVSFVLTAGLLLQIPYMRGRRRYWGWFVRWCPSSDHMIVVGDNLKRYRISRMQMVAAGRTTRKKS